MFYGSYHHQLDDKGRLRIPPKFRELLGEKPMMMLGFEKCLVVYPRADFEERISKRFDEADVLDPDMADVKRIIFANTMEVSEDKQNRVQILPFFAESCGMSKSLVTIGARDCIEIWDEEVYNEHMKSVDVKKILSSFRNKQ